MEDHSCPICLNQFQLILLTSIEVLKSNVRMHAHFCWQKGILCWLVFSSSQETCLAKTFHSWELLLNTQCASTYWYSHCSGPFSMFHWAWWLLWLTLNREWKGNMCPFGLDLMWLLISCCWSQGVGILNIFFHVFGLFFVRWGFSLGSSFWVPLRFHLTCFLVKMYSEVG